MSNHFISEPKVAIKTIMDDWGHATKSHTSIAG